MSGPGIATATVKLDLDGKTLPAEAKALGEEVGESFGSSMNEGADKGLSDFGKELNNVLREEAKGTAKKGGRGVGSSFSDEMNDILRSRSSETSRILAETFADEDGFNKFRENLQSSADHFVSIDEAADELKTHLDRAFLDKTVTGDQFEQYGRHIRDIADDAKHAEPDLARLRDTAHRLSSGLEVATWQQWLDKLDGVPGRTGAIRAALAPELTQLQNLHRAARDGVIDFDDFGEAFVRAYPKVHALGGALHAGDDALHDVIRGAEDAGRLVEGFGAEAEKADGKTGGFGKSVGKLGRAFGQFDPGDNFGQLFALILSYAGPIAGLLSAVAAEAVILGTVAAGAAIGVGALAIGFQQLATAKNLSGELLDVQKAFKGLAGPLGDLKDTLLSSEFAGMAKPFRDLGDALPKLGPGVKAIGDAINGFLKTLTGAITANIGPIDDLLKGFAPIIGSVGDAVVSLAGVFGGLFKAAMPFAQDFASSLAGTVKQWSDWINSIAGQKALQKWFADAQPILGQVGDVLGDLADAFGDLITPTTLTALSTTLTSLGNIATELGGIGAALAPFGAAVGQAIDLIGGVINSLDPLISGVGQLISGMLDDFKPTLDFVELLLNTGLKPIGDFLGILGTIFHTMGGIAESVFQSIQTAVAPVVTFIGQLYDGVQQFVNTALKEAQPAIAAFEGAIKTIGGAISDLLSGLLGAGKQTDLFKAASQGASDFLNGPFKEGVKNVADGFNSLAKFVRDEVVPAIHELDWAKVTDGMNHIVQIVPDIIDALGTVIDSIKQVINIFGTWTTAGVQAAKTVGDALTGAAKVADDVMHGNFIGALKDGQTAMQTNATNAATMKDDIGKAFTETGKSADALGKDHDKLQRDIGDAMGKAKTAIKDFQSAGDGNLKALSSRLGLTGDDSAAFRKLIEDSAKKSGVSLRDLADAKSLPDLETRLGITGQAAKDKFQKSVVSAMGESGDSMVKLPPKVQAIEDKLNHLNGVKSNPRIFLEGEQDALGSVASVRSALDKLNGKVSQVFIDTVKRQVGQGTAAIGGIMAGGRLIAGGRTAFAGGGIVRFPTTFGNVLTGEAGPEAIVPLNRPLAQVDPSVRNLSAYAQGLSGAGGGRGSYVAAGAIQVITPAADPSIVASQVVDRLVPVL